MVAGAGVGVVGERVIARAIAGMRSRGRVGKIEVAGEEGRVGAGTRAQGRLGARGRLLAGVR